MTGFSGESAKDEELVSAARKALHERSSLLTLDQTLATIQELKHWVGEELTFEEGASASFGRLLSELWHAEYLEQLPPLLNRFERLAAAHFVRRGSVPAFHGFCSAWREGVLRRILHFAEEGPELSDQGEFLPHYALLVSGTLGRREQTLEEAERYFLVWSEGDPHYFEQLAYRVIAILDRFGLVGKEGAALLGRTFWRGSLDDWDLFVDGEAPPRDDRANRLELFADLRHLGGEPGIGQTAIRMARARLAAGAADAEMRELALEVAVAPVGLNFMGGLKLERSGEHAGCFDLERAALAPLAGAVRMLAAGHDLDPGPTLDRLAALGSLGVLDRALADRLAAAYHLLAGFKIRREIALEQPYLNPAQLSQSEREQLKSALQAVRQLQSLVRDLLAKKRGKWWRLGSACPEPVKN